MKALVKRAGVIGLLAVVVLMPVALAAASECAQFITTGAGDSPNSGQLQGETTVTETTTYGSRFDGGWSGGYSLSGGFTRTTTVSYTYNIGTYKMDDGTVIRVRCDTYQRVG